ncbi:MAG TPA: hypothetical protein VEM36_04545 [Xanthobacteraceae bacterium]|nr:hypothetical protein [Xanthobacteraceae bacterium]
MSTKILKISALALAIGAASLAPVASAYAAPKGQPAISAAEKAWMDRASQNADGGA